MSPVKTLAPVAASLVVLAGCSSVRTVEIRSEPAGAEVLVEGQRIGVAPISHGFDFDDPDAMYEVVVQKEGYVPNRRRISQLHLDVAKELAEARGYAAPDGRPVLVIRVDEDEAWSRTAPSELANTWVELEVDPVLDQTQVWEILIDTLTKHYPELVNQDNAAGYIASAVKQERLSRGPTASVQVKNQFFCSITSRTPLVYKVTITSQIQGDAAWTDYGRIFKRDTALLTELRARLVSQ